MGLAFNTYLYKIILYLLLLLLLVNATILVRYVLYHLRLAMRGAQNTNAVK